MTVRERGLLGWATAGIGAALLAPPMTGIGWLNRGIYLLWETEPEDITVARGLMVCSAFLAACAGTAFALYQPKR